MLNDAMYATVYQFEALENGVMVRHTVYRTCESIKKRGGAILHETAKLVLGSEVMEGMWKPDRNPR